jgi:hypothetical protein
MSADLTEKLHSLGEAARDAARILALPSILDTWKPKTAINLDGGSSSGMWAANSISLFIVITSRSP